MLIDKCVNDMMLMIYGVNIVITMHFGQVDKDISVAKLCCWLYFVGAIKLMVVYRLPLKTSFKNLNLFQIFVSH